jgi:hypothetical protein
MAVDRSETMGERSNPILISDFDGTLVHVAGNFFQKALKYPLNARIGAHRFLEGVAATDTEIGPIISRRPHLGRSFVTRRTLMDTGLSRWFPEKEDVILAGSINPFRAGASEQFKAEAMIEHAKRQAVGIIDDKPDKIGLEIIQLLRDAEEGVEPIVLGAVKTPDSYDRVRNLMNLVVDSVPGVKQDYLSSDDGLGGIELSRIKGSVSFMLAVVELPDMSFDAGVLFGNRLQEYAA